MTESAVVDDPLQTYLDRTSDAALILCRLDRLGRDDERTQGDVEMLLEAFATWVENRFAHTPKITDALKPLARRSASSRYAQFGEHFAQRLSGGHRFVDDLTGEPMADETELARLAADHTPRSDGTGAT